MLGAAQLILAHAHTVLNFDGRVRALKESQEELGGESGRGSRGLCDIARDWGPGRGPRERRKSLAPAESRTSSGVKLAECDFSRGKCP